MLLELGIGTRIVIGKRINESLLGKSGIIHNLRVVGGPNITGIAWPITPSKASLATFPVRRFLLQINAMP